MFFQRYQALQLLISLTLLIVISPFFDGAQGTAQLVLHLLFSLQLVSVVYVAAGSGRQLFIGVLLAGAWLVLRWSSLFAQIETAELISDFALVCINVYAVGVSLKRIITAKERSRSISYSDLPPSTSCLRSLGRSYSGSSNSWRPDHSRSRIRQVVAGGFNFCTTVL